MRPQSSSRLAIFFRGAAQRHRDAVQVHHGRSDRQRQRPSITIVDDGEGQTPSDMPKTILSLHRGNKNSIPFVQGKFNMGGSGVLEFCGVDHNVELVLSVGTRRSCRTPPRTRAVELYDYSPRGPAPRCRAPADSPISRRAADAPGQWHAAHVCRADAADFPNKEPAIRAGGRVGHAVQAV